jgi:hypothetical protein
MILTSIEAHLVGSSATARKDAVEGKHPPYRATLYLGPLANRDTCV